MGNRCASQCSCDEVSVSSGSPIPPWRRRFRIAFAVFHPSPFSQFDPAVDPAVRFASPPEYRARPARGPLRTPLDEHSLERLPWGLRPHRDINQKRPLPVLRRGSRAFTQARSVPSSAFLTPSTACSASGLAGLFHPAATSGIPLQGFSLSHSRTVSSTAVALLSLASGPCSRVAPTTPVPDVRPSRPCSVRESVFDE
jgi:hypothetical protein